jgi:hypothetical protein
MFAAKHSKNNEQIQTLTNDKQETGSDAAAQPAKPQLAAKNEVAPVGSVQESRLPPTPKAVPVANIENSDETSAEHYDGALAIRPRKLRLAARKHHSKTGVPPSSTTSSALPTTVIVD